MKVAFLQTCSGHLSNDLTFTFALFTGSAMKQGILGATPPKQASMLYTSVWIFVNLAVSIAIVLLNKWVYVYVGFPNITMSCTHFIITSLGLAVCRHFGIFNPVRIPFQTVVPLAVTFCGFVALTNLSLQNNAVGTFQLLKTLTMPTIMVSRF